MIEDHNGFGIEAESGGDAALVHADFGDHDVAGLRALMIVRQNASAQLDRDGIEREQLVLESRPMTSSNNNIWLKMPNTHVTTATIFPMRITSSQRKP